MENLNKTEKTEKLLGKDIKVEKEGKIENESHIESNNPTNTMKSLSPSTQYSINVNSKIQHSIVNPLLLSNKICTSKYNFINAVPKILCEQFSKVGNIYFLFLAILQMVPVISQSGGSPVMLLPLLFVVLVNGIKDFCEDYKRKQSDNRENKTKCTLIDPNTQGEKLVNWEDLKPGDILKIYKDEYFPADLLMMYSINKNGVAYVETKNLDGETNLKYKECVKSTYRLLKHFETEEERVEIAKKTFGRITCDYPNASMYDFEGVYYFENRASVVSFDKSFNFGSQRKEISNHTFDRMHSYDNIENSNLNENVNQNRVSSVSKNLNQVNITAMLDRRLSAIEDEGEKLNSNENSTIILEFNNLLLRGSSLRNTDYIYGIVIYSGHFSKIMLNSLNARSKQSKVFKIMNSQLKFIILLQMVICFTFALFYSIDPNPYEDIFHFKFKRSMVPRFCVNFIYAFLSWLLTICNIVPISLLVTIEMIKFCQAVFISWDSKMYDKENRRTAIVQSSALNEELGQVHDIFSDKTGTLTKNVMQFKYMVIGDFLYGSDKHINLEELKEDKITNVDFNDPSLFDHWNNTQHVNSENIHNFIYSLALCHSIIVERKNNELIYNASSPDELALVNAAKYFGVEFTERTDDNFIILRYQGNEFRYKLLHIFEFNSNRKRMSVVVRDENNQIKLICKGADNVISQRLDSHKSYNVEKRVNYYLEEFGRKGLRTLMIAEKVISDLEYKTFFKNYYKALTSTVDKKEKLDKCYEMLEKEMILLGATAIEDCLQDDLKPTLEAFREVGIKIWMLTGDHPFTAVSIAHSCGLIEKTFKVVMISSSKIEEINHKLFEIIDEDKRDVKLCLVITGDAMTIIQKPTGAGMKNLFLMAIRKAKCVICSRVSPKQKAELILMVKQQDPRKTTLAIGDGANDVNMITSADVGIGIMGNEGQQAARASDYVIGQFSFLKRLLFVHGREAYRKNSFAVGYVLWKNFLFITPCIFLGFSSFFSGQTIYDPILDTLYNILFTAYPIGWFATYDKELNYDKLESSPKLYEGGMKNHHFNTYVFWRWYVYAATAGLIIYWNITSVFAFAVNNDTGLILDLWAIGTSMYTCIVFFVNLKIIIATNTHNIFSVILVIFSIASYIITIFFSSRVKRMETTGQWEVLLWSKGFLLTMTLVITACVLCEYGWRSIQFIIEEYIIKMKKVDTSVEYKRVDSVIQKIDDESIMEKGYAVKINSSINNNMGIKDAFNDVSDVTNNEIEIPKEPAKIDSDQEIVLNKNRRYTGFAFAEDVANVNILNQRIKDNFFDSKFKNE